MHSIADILTPYAELERSVQQLISQLFSRTCGLCTVCCCRADICEEVTASPFLSLLLDQQEIPADRMDDRFGWLDLHGCLLECGRPPVCHTYFCDELLRDLPDDDSRQVVRTLGRLVHHAGKEALGERHLAEIINPADLEQVDFVRILRRIEEAQAAYDVIEDYVQTGRLSAAGNNILEVISAGDQSP